MRFLNDENFLYPFTFYYPYQPIWSALKIVDLTQIVSLTCCSVCEPLRAETNFAPDGATPHKATGLNLSIYERVRDICDKPCDDSSCVSSQLLFLNVSSKVLNINDSLTEWINKQFL
jgi:hypothetical protein